jgi:hypothetical protein
MEMYCKIQKVLPLAQRNYTDRDGQPQVFKSKGFILTNGLNEVYAEATGKYAEALEGRALDTTQFHVADLRFRQRSYADKDGVMHYNTEVELTRLNVV